MLRHILSLLGLAAAMLAAAPVAAQRYDIIDMHAHALPIDYYGPVPQRICLGMPTVPVRDTALPAQSYYGEMEKQACPHPTISPSTEAALRDQTVAVWKRRHILALVSGPAATVTDWHAAAPVNTLTAMWVNEHDGRLMPTVETLRAAHKAGRLAAIAEVGIQYDGIAPDDPRMEPYYALAEELDVPIGLHIGPGPPGIAYYGSPKMRAVSPLRFQEILVRHPKLRLWVMHAGWPLGDDMIALLYAHPQVYVDIGVIDQLLPRPGFYDYLKRLVDAGMIDHIMFGSDNMLWPDGVEWAIRTVEEAPFLDARQKRAILHDNAARFLRLGAAK